MTKIYLYKQNKLGDCLTFFFSKSSSCLVGFVTCMEGTIVSEVEIFPGEGGIERRIISPTLTRTKVKFTTAAPSAGTLMVLLKDWNLMS